MTRSRVRRVQLALCAAGSLGISLGAPRAAAAQAVAAVDSVKKAIGDSVRKALGDSVKTADRTCAGGRPLVRGKIPPADSMPTCIPQLEIFADGNVKDVLGGKEAANAAGALGLHYTGSRFDVTGLINVAGTPDTVRSGYGASVLLPAAGSALNAGALIVRWNSREWNDTSCVRSSNPVKCNWGLRLHADASTRLWATRIERVAAAATTPPAAGQAAQAIPDSVDRIAETMEVPMFGGGIDFSYSFFRDLLHDETGAVMPTQMVLDIGYAHRSIRGNIASADRDSVRRRLLTTPRKDFDGIEIGLTMIYNQIRASLTYVRLWGKVDGLTNGQIIALVDLRAAFGNKLLKRN